ncbi:MAG: butyrate kinase [Alistipes sp.]|nr:butyrate kinase [Alistipes sp.]
MEFRILTVNPGSTSTKVALFCNERPLLDIVLRHDYDTLRRYEHIADQMQWRRDIVLRALSEQGFSLSELSAVVGRGGLTKPIAGGVYEVNDAMLHDLCHPWMEHACNLGGLISHDIACMAGVKAYIADPGVVDEMDEMTHLTGLPQIRRISIFHALNQRAVARRHAAACGCRYEDMNLIVAHMGGGISVGAHYRGRVVDNNNALNGDGSFTPERAGTLPAISLVEMCYSGRYTCDEVKKMLAGKGGITAHLGTNSVVEVVERIERGDEQARLVLDAMCYNISKQIGSMAAVLGGVVDGILLTGGIAYCDYVVERIGKRCSFIAPISVYAGENEMSALAESVLGVLRGEIEPKTYL